MLQSRNNYFCRNVFFSHYWIANGAWRQAAAKFQEGLGQQVGQGRLVVCQSFCGICKANVHPDLCRKFSLLDINLSSNISYVLFQGTTVCDNCMIFIPLCFVPLFYSILFLDFENNDGSLNYT